MHDPMTVAFEWSRLGITIWHVDPEKDGNEDSCDWFGDKKTRENGWYPGIVDQYERMSPEAREAVDFVWYTWRRQLGRPWWKHPRWHVWHWRVQWDFLLHLKRWLFSRCAKCGRHFRWGYAPLAFQWDSPGPRWFKGERDVCHFECYAPRVVHEE